MKKWSENAREAITPVFEGIKSLPFIQELMSGTLDKRKFAFYIQQDSLYLLDYGKALTGIATRLTKTEHIEAFLGFAGDCITVEKMMHEMFRTELEMNATEGKTLTASANDWVLKTSPSCTLYTSYLYSTFNATTEVMAAAVLPCFWIYMEVGRYILANQNMDNNPFQAWIDTYVGDEFEKSVAKAIQICDELAEKCTVEQQDAMTKAFATCSRMEWLFWDSAYRMEQWPI